MPIIFPTGKSTIFVGAIGSGCNHLAYKRAKSCLYILMRDLLNFYPKEDLFSGDTLQDKESERLRLYDFCNQAHRLKKPLVIQGIDLLFAHEPIEFRDFIGSCRKRKIDIFCSAQDVNALDITLFQEVYLGHSNSSSEMFGCFRSNFDTCEFMKISFSTQSFRP